VPTAVVGPASKACSDCDCNKPDQRHGPMRAFEGEPGERTGPNVPNEMLVESAKTSGPKKFSRLSRVTVRASGGSSWPMISPTT
jgi:hypothetical protein